MSTPKNVSLGLKVFLAVSLLAALGTLQIWWRSRSEPPSAIPVTASEFPTLPQQQESRTETPPALPKPLTDPQACAETLAQLLEPLNLEFRHKPGQEAQVSAAGCRFPELELIYLVSGAVVSEPLALELTREKQTSWGTRLALNCRSGHLDIQVDRHASQTWKWEWRTQRFDTRCFPAIEKSLSPPMYMQFQGSGSMEVDPALVGGFKGELQGIPIGLVFNRNFLVEGGDIYLGFQDSRVLLRKPIILGSPITEEPRFEKGEPGDFKPISLVLNGEILFSRPPYHEAEWRLRGRIRFPAGTSHAATGLEPDLTAALETNPSFGTAYLIGVRGAITEPRIEPLQPK